MNTLNNFPMVVTTALAITVASFCLHVNWQPAGIVLRQVRSA
jgi:hypothetical protein